jgi:DNA/RNA endonuclease G (NUC1)
MGETMTAKERAEDLVSKFFFLTENLENQKKCALTTADQIILEQCKSSEKKDAKYQDERLSYWFEVKREIENI